VPVRSLARRLQFSVQRFLAKRLRRPTGVEWSAIVFLGLAAICVVIWQFTDVADQWMPNAATDATSIAVTITIIEGILRRDARRRLEPRVQRAYEYIAGELEFFAYSVAREYAHTHDESYTRPPSSQLRILAQHWLAEAEAAELRPTEDDSLVQAGDRLRLGLDRLQGDYSEILEPRFVIAMDDASRQLRSAIGLHAVMDALVDNNQYPSAARAIVAAAARFATVLEARGVRVAVWDEVLVGLEVTRDDEMRRRGRRLNPT
jgi:hypothetical protein